MPDNITKVREWTQSPPFAFIYDGKPSSELLPKWTLHRETKKLDSKRTQQTLTYTDPETKLRVRCVSLVYKDFPTLEWTVYVKNTGSSDTPVLSDIKGIDADITSDKSETFVLHHHKGTIVRPDDYQPFETPIKAGDKLHFAPPAGRPCGGVFPYFNLQCGMEGMILAVGWPGQWSADFTCDTKGTLEVSAGQETTRMKLHPGEEIRTPLIAVLFWNGDRQDSQNTWRRWMLAHNVPKIKGKLPSPMMPAVSGNHFPGLLCNEKDELLFIDRYLEEGIKPSLWWMDAGWYPNKGDWTSTGTWEVDKARFPNGLKSISDYCHQKGMKLIVWFEPERVTSGSYLAKRHPDWLLAEPAPSSCLLDLGNPEALKWITEQVDGILVREGIDLYRQDYNIDPLAYWQAHDTGDRQGITENHYVTGYLAFWDELRSRHPDMLIDTCASGGHRNDLETLRRSVPLLRSDYIFDPVGEQCHSYGLWQWMPYTGTGFINFDTYIFRSTMGPSTTLGMDTRRHDLDYSLLKKLIAQWQKINANFYGDFYPLTPYSTENTAWMAWQFDRPEKGEGMVQAFRRAENTRDSIQLKLHSLDPISTYALTDIDTGTPETHSGRDLMEEGLQVTVKDRPGAVVLSYRKLK